MVDDEKTQQPGDRGGQIKTSGDTIAAIASGQAHAGVGIVRLSGPAAASIARALLGRAPKPRHAYYRRFTDAQRQIIDDGLLLFFPGPASFTGEDVLELQAHGSPPLLAALLQRCIELGARPARPGEFSERAFLNDKFDLAQAEAVADLIAAGSLSAARAARRSLDGAFSAQVQILFDALVALRVWVEAAIDFPDEEIDFLAAPELAQRLAQVQSLMQQLRAEAVRGKRLVDGLHVVIVGEPNAGKSSLLNSLAGVDRAIVSEIAGTTRDVLRETIQIDGIELTLVDTAGIRETTDVIEREGVRRAGQELAGADLALCLLDGQRPLAEQRAALMALTTQVPQRLWLCSKADCLIETLSAAANNNNNDDLLMISTVTGQGLDSLRSKLREAAGMDGGQGAFSARQRHLDGLAQADAHLQAAAEQLKVGAGELAAEELRLAQEALSQLTGKISSDQLLGYIFNSFCIGK